jgi:hypothetical protein
MGVFLSLLERIPGNVHIFHIHVHAWNILQGRFPQHGEEMLRVAEAWHSTVTEAELAATCGLRDPAHSQIDFAFKYTSGQMEER